jgi:hypothetical protein
LAGLAQGVVEHGLLGMCVRDDAAAELVQGRFPLIVVRARSGEQAVQQRFEAPVILRPSREAASPQRGFTTELATQRDALLSPPPRTDNARATHATAGVP